jgi:hypothetical protein
MGPDPEFYLPAYPPPPPCNCYSLQNYPFTWAYLSRQLMERQNMVRSASSSVVTASSQSATASRMFTVTSSYQKPKVIYGGRSPKFIWSPCHVIGRSCTHWLRPSNPPPPPPVFGLVCEGAIGQ